ncbi:Phosphatidylserine decarboxylase proenzyme 2 [Yarrowia sp. C11]|nr:Phosphatidylserine decarboxylase proenzyme 2 [Yarrowia sp. E02]KAG5369139.1 Phosphatidylserine decarboxylase proenzyme 2 [Yarrowia sp. C11]
MRFLKRRGKTSKSRQEGSVPSVFLRVNLIQARGIAPREREKNTKCEPYAVISCGDFRFTTHTIHNSVNPDWDAWIDIPVQPGDESLDVVVWDRVRFNKDYLGEVSIPLLDMFSKGATETSVQSFPLHSTRSKAAGYVSGDVSMKFSLVDSQGESNPELFDFWQKTVDTEELESDMPASDVCDEAGGDSDVEMSNLANEMFRTNILDLPAGMRLSLDLSSESLSESGAESDVESDQNGNEEQSQNPDDYVGVPDVSQATIRRGDENHDDFDAQHQHLHLQHAPGTARKQQQLALVGPPGKNSLAAQNMMARTPPINNSGASTEANTPDLLDVPTKSKSKKTKKKKKTQHYELNCSDAVLGVIFLEILHITDLPPLRNMTRTGFDVDPFVIISFGRSTFRTQSKRHTLNPTYNERVIFPVLKHEQSFSIGFTVMDKDKISTHDFVADGQFEIKPLLELAPRPDPGSMLYDMDHRSAAPVPLRKRRFRRARKARNNNLAATDFDDFMVSSSDLPERSDMNEYDDEEVEGTESAASSPVENMRVFELPLRIKNQRYTEKHNPVLTIRARFMPYAALRQRLWTSLLQKYDVTGSGTINIVDLTQMLEELNSTLSSTTVVGWWKKFGRSIDEDLTIPEAVTCLEQQIMKDSLVQEHQIMKQRRASLKAGGLKGLATGSNGPAAASSASNGSSSMGTSPVAARTNSYGSVLTASSAGSSIPGLPQTNSSSVTRESSAAPSEEHSIGGSGSSNGTPPSIPVPSIMRSTTHYQEPLLITDGNVSDSETSLGQNQLYHGNPSTDTLVSLANSDDHEPERVIRLETCPICNQPRFNKRAEMDIVTHLATCANEQSVHKILSSRYVSKSQAHKKWYSKIVTKVTHGNYRLGANSANILVQDRATGLIEEEKMSIYVRLGIRLLYKGLSSREMERKRVRRLLRSLTNKQGRKFDSALSVKSIKPFIRFHHLDMSEVRDPLDSFKNFNQFFYRKLKEGARPVQNTAAGAVCCAADSRATMYRSVSKATQIWIKGREFTIKRLFGDAYPNLVDRFNDCSIAIFRLAPQDYHRFHSPVEGIVGESKTIDGEYYTVNPMAIRSALDVFGENVRVLTPIETNDFGTVMFIAVGAMMVGSTVMTVKDGEHVDRGQELGYFQFGGSTCLVLFQKDCMVFDDDLVSNSEQAIETLVRVGQSLGHKK